MTLQKTIPKIFYEHASNNRNQVAFRNKYLGIWNEVKWEEFRSKVEHLSKTLYEELFFRPGDRLAIMGENNGDWAVSHMATQILGGIPVVIHHELSEKKYATYLQETKPSIVIVSGIEEVEKLLEIEEEIPSVEYILYRDNSGLRHYYHPKLVYLGELLKTGEKKLIEDPDWIQHNIQKIEPTDTAILFYQEDTERTLSFTHQQIIEAANRLAQENLEELDDYLPIMPLSWLNEYIICMILPLLKGIVINYPEKPNTILKDLVEIAPHTILAPPRVFRRLRTNFTIRMENTTWLKRKVFSFFQSYAYKVAQAKGEQKVVSGTTKLMHRLGDLIIHRFIRKHYGFQRVRQAYIAGGILDSESHLFFQSLGVDMKTYSNLEDLELLQYKEANVADDFHDSLQNKEITRTENKLKESLYIKEAVCFSSNNTDLTAMLNVDFDMVSRWADQKQLAYTTYAELSTLGEVVEMIKQEVDKRIQESAYSLKSFILLPKQLSEEDEELTYTLQIRREYVKEKYAPLIESAILKEREIQFPLHGENITISLVALRGERGVT